MLKFTEVFDRKIYKPNEIVKSINRLDDPNKFLVNGEDKNVVDVIIKRSIILITLGTNTEILIQTGFTYYFKHQMREFLDWKNKERRLMVEVTNGNAPVMSKIKKELITFIIKSHPQEHLSLRKIRKLYYEIERNSSFSIETLRKYLRKTLDFTFKKSHKRNRNYCSTNTC